MPNKEAGPRDKLPVLVTDAQTLGAIGVIRSLGQAGYPVHASACRVDALGLFSNFARFKVICPAYDHETFLPWLREYVRRHDIRAIVPSEGLLLAVRPVFSEFAHLLPFSRDVDAVYSGLSKFDLFERLLESRAPAPVTKNLPPTLLLPSLKSLPGVAELEKLGSPLYIKVDGSYSDTSEDGKVYEVASPTDARDELHSLASRFRKALVQGHVPGQGVGAFFLLWDRRVLAEFMHRRLHEVPHTGGTSSLRESWWHSAIRDDALAKVEYLGWSGVAMMEYRWDASSDRFYLMEMNGRFWGSLHLALYAGVDFPVLLLDAFHGLQVSNQADGFPRGLKCRYTFPKEVQYVWSRLKDHRLPLSSRIWSVAEFFQLSFDSRIYSDLLFPGDRKLFWESLKRFASDAMQSQKP
ncbi:MAG TPA: hypothetical protein VH985_13955 [Candidatus Binatia bacterium]|jgi:predicted ATP-grasp superfamily ATP-dependent carboligase